MFGGELHESVRRVQAVLVGSLVLMVPEVAPFEDRDLRARHVRYVGLVGDFEPVPQADGAEALASTTLSRLLSAI